MTIQLPELPYAMDALEPHISRETLEYHHGKHHASYVEKLQELLEDSDFKNADLETIVKKSSGDIFNNAAQVWNHNFYWKCLSPDGGGEPSGAVADVIRAAFDSFEDFSEKFSSEAGDNFGSGWTWLVQKPDGSVGIVNTSNAENPLTTRDKPLLTVDVWEHAYYIDYRNERPKYLDAFWSLVNWEFVGENLGA
jgi:Fe-Mn family superoxide dismutase